MNPMYVYIAIGIVMVVLSVVFITAALMKKTNTQYSTSNATTCQAHVCGSIDPVSNPDYNMRDVIEQSLLLEDHLVSKNKRCIDCICKHFLTIHAECVESVAVAGPKVKNYPLMKENPEFYDKLFKYWLKNKDNDEVYLEVAEKLRLRRKELVAIYVVGNKIYV